MSTSIPQNDYRPELSSNFQTYRETDYLLHYVLTGYGLPLQLQNLIIGLFVLTKPGEPYYITDPQIADYLAFSSPNYVCSLRGSLKDWLSETDESGARRPLFVSIEDSSYNHRTKAHIPTKYIFSREFGVILSELSGRVPEHQSYPFDWIKAVKAVCDDWRPLLLEFGFWKHRKRTAERAPGRIFATYLIHLENHLKKIFGFLVTAGHNPVEVKELLQIECLMALETIAAETVVLSASDSYADLQSFFESADSINAAKRERPATVFPKAYRRKLKDVWSQTKRTVIDAEGGAPFNGSESSVLLDDRGLGGAGKVGRAPAAVDTERRLYLEKIKAEI